MTDQRSTTHAIERTSPKGPGSPFRGTCILCGMTDLRMGDAIEPCTNRRSLSDDQALIACIEGDDHDRSRPGSQITLMHRHAVLRADRLTTITREEWTRLVAAFPDQARWNSANLAAHNWTVHLLGDHTLLSTCRWAHGYVYHVDGQTRRTTAKEDGVLYPMGPYGKRVDLVDDAALRALVDVGAFSFTTDDGGL